MALKKTDANKFWRTQYTVNAQTVNTFKNRLDQTWPWVGLTRGLGWVGSSSVKYDSLPNSTGINISCSDIPITFIFRRFSVIYELRVPFFLAELLTVFSNNSRVMIKTGPAQPDEPNF